MNYDIISTLGTGKPNTLNLNSSSVLLTCMNPPLYHIVCNRWLKRPQLIRCFLLAQNSRSKNSFDHWFLVSVRSYAAMAPALWRMNSWCRCGVKGCPSSKSSSAWWFIGSECSCVGNGLLLRSSFTSFAIHLLNLSLWLQRERFRRAKFVLRCYSTGTPGYKQNQINLREQLISEYASWFPPLQPQKGRTPSHTGFSGCNSLIPMTSNEGCKSEIQWLLRSPGSASYCQRIRDHQGGESLPSKEAPVSYHVVSSFFQHPKIRWRRYA